MINQIVLSCNEDENYSSFWKPVSYAYKKMFPEAIIHLAFLTNRSETDSLVKEFREYGKVTLFKPVSDIQEFAQAKLIRFLLASEQDNDVCYIDDIDLFPLKRSFITSKTEVRPANHLLCVGGEVYANNGCYPVSQMTAEGNIFKKLFNPNNLSYENLLNSYRGNTMYDKRESIDLELNFAADNYFSDERLIRRLRTLNPVPIHEEKRGYSNFMVSTIDRMDWKIHEGKLFNHEYENAHCERPMKKEQIDKLIEYIDINY